MGEENANRGGVRGGANTDSSLLLRRTLQNGRRGVTRSESQRKRRRLQGQAGDNGSCGGGGGGCCCFAGTALSDGVWLSGWRLNLPRGASARRADCALEPERAAHLFVEVLWPAAGGLPHQPAELASAAQCGDGLPHGVGTAVGARKRQRDAVHRKRTLQESACSRMAAR